MKNAIADCIVLVQGTCFKGRRIPNVHCARRRGLATNMSVNEHLATIRLAEIRRPDGSHLSVDPFIQIREHDATTLQYAHGTHKRKLSCKSMYFSESQIILCRDDIAKPPIYPDLHPKRHCVVTHIFPTHVHHDQRSLCKSNRRNQKRKGISTT